MTIVHYFYTTYSSAMSQCLYLQHYKKNRNFRRSALQEKRKIAPTCRFAASPEVGPGASVGTLKIGYLRIQALSQDKEQGVHPRAVT
jgi:hypothetical protein